jgi:SRR1
VSLSLSNDSFFTAPLTVCSVETRLDIRFDNFENMIKSVHEHGGSGRYPIGICWYSLRDKQLPPRFDSRELIKLYEDQEAQWLQSHDYKLIEQHLLKAMPTCPTKIVGIGLGSPLHRKENLDNILCQHAGIKVIAEWFRKQHPEQQITSYCQDPDYHQVDLGLLDHLKIKHVKNPHAFLETDENSIVISISPDCPTKQIIADDKRFWPLAIICDSVRTEEQEIGYYLPKGN